MILILPATCTGFSSLGLSLFQVLTLPTVLSTLLNYPAMENLFGNSAGTGIYFGLQILSFLHVSYQH